MPHEISLVAPHEVLDQFYKIFFICIRLHLVTIISSNNWISSDDTVVSEAL